MPVETTLVQIERLQTAIAVIENGNQSYSVDNMRFTKGNLATYYARLDKLLARYRREQGNSGVLTRPNFSQGGTGDEDCNHG